jgi:hypothetical protein
MEYGATGDGMTDDTNAIQQALNAMPSGWSVRLPDGDYAISAPLTVSDGVTLAGDGQVTICPLSTNGAIRGSGGMAVRGIVFNWSAVPQNPSTVIAVLGGAGARIENCVIIGSGAGAGIHLYPTCSGGLVENNTIEQCAYDGILLGANSLTDTGAHHQVIGNTVSGIRASADPGNRAAGIETQLADTLIKNNHVSDCDGTGIWMGGADCTADANGVDGCALTIQYAHGLVSKGTRGAVTGNTITNNGRVTADPTAGIMISIVDGGVSNEDTVVVENTCADTRETGKLQKYGVLVQDGAPLIVDRLLIDGNQLCGNALAETYTAGCSGEITIQ